MLPSLAAAEERNDVVRRSSLVTMAVATAVAWAAIAHAATAHAATAPSAPQLISAPFVSPAILQWTPGADPTNVLQTVFRAPGACTQPPTPAIAVRTYPDNTTSQHFALPGDGTFCFSIGATDALGATAIGPGLTVTIDTTPPTATVAVSGQAAGGIVQGTVRITRTSADAVSGVASSVLHLGAVGACAAGPTVGGSWNTTTYANGSYDVCNVVTDRAGLVTTAVVTVTVANVVSAPDPVAPALAPSAVAPTLAVVPSAPVLVGAVDKDAPGAPSKLAVVLPRAKTGAAALVPLTLRWVNPKAADLARVVVILNLRRAPRSAKDGSVVYNGLRTSAVFKLHPGKSAYVALYAYDHTGNVSAPARRTVSLASLIPLRPLTGTLVSTPPRMTWQAESGVAYYNIQVFRNGRRVLVGWPSQASYQLPEYLLQPGVYTWFVWPAFKHAGAAPTFGDLIGRATFVFQK
jgi:hypothetical protein